jgi:myosin heavy subunit
MLETTRIRREGFPFRLTFPEFCAQYSGIAFPFSQRVAGTKEKSTEIMAAATKQLTVLNAGNSKV